MHELSIAESLLRVAAEHVPAGATLRAVRVCAGPLRGIDPTALQWAWQSVLAGHPWHDARLKLKELPWRMRCPRCNAEWTDPNASSDCPCGCDAAHPVGGNELLLEAIEVDELVPRSTTEVMSC